MEQVQEGLPPEPVPRMSGPLVIGRTPILRSDPRGLPNVDRRRPDSEMDGADLPGLIVRAASIRGDAHRHLGTTRQDAMGFWGIDETRLLACVADGLGSKSLSHIGAAMACVSAHSNLTDLLQAADSRTAEEGFFENISDDLRKWAKEKDTPEESLCTTLVTAIIDTDRSCASLIRVGDSTAMLLRQGIWSSCFSQKLQGPISTSETAALPRDTQQVESAEVDLDHGDMLLLCTDGLANPMDGEQVCAQLSTWWSQPTVPSLLEFLWQLSFQAKSHDDDRTAICVWRV